MSCILSRRLLSQQGGGGGAEAERSYVTTLPSFSTSSSWFSSSVPSSSYCLCSSIPCCCSSLSLPLLFFLVSSIYSLLFLLFLLLCSFIFLSCFCSTLPSYYSFDFLLILTPTLPPVFPSYSFPFLSFPESLPLSSSVYIIIVVSVLSSQKVIIFSVFEDSAKSCLSHLCSYS